MKKFLIGFFLAASALAQVDSTQLNKKTGGGVTGDGSNAIAVAPYQGTSGPSSPVTGQLWCDTNYTPCSMKQWDGAAWQLVSPGTSVPTQTDQTFPGTPANGQIFYDTTSGQLWIYNGARTLWCLWGGGTCTSANITDTFGGSVITAPSAAPTIADNATAGTLTTGNKSCKFTYVNSTGGETTASPVSNTVNFTGSHTIDFSGITVGGTGTTARRIYCSKAGAQVGGPWYWVWTISDNVTTSTTATNIAKLDAAFVLLIPKNNYSAALNARWTIQNTTASTTSGGCGSTGSAMVCYSSDSAPPLITAVTTDPTVRAILDLASYRTGDYTIQYRITDLSLTNDHSDGAVTGPTLGGFRVNTADNEHAFTMASAPIGSATGACTTGVYTWTGPLSSTNPPTPFAQCRASVGTSHGFGGSACTGSCSTSGPTTVKPGPWSGTASWVRFVKKGNVLNGLVSWDGSNWFAMGHNVAVNTSQGWDVSSNNPTQFEINIQMSGNATAQRYYIMLDNFTLTVN